MLTQLYQRIHRIHQILHTGTVREQDALLNDLHEALRAAPDALYPAQWYPCLIDLLGYYCRTILPQTSLTNADQESIAEGFGRAIERLQTHAPVAGRVETQLHSLLRRFRQHREQTGLATLIQDIIRIAEAAAPAQQTGRKPGPPIPKDLAGAYRALQKAPWLADRIEPFFDRLLQHLSPHCSPAFIGLFRHQLAECVHMQAVLVNTLNGQGVVSRLVMTTTVVANELDNLTFDNHVDNAMLHSSLVALRVSRRYLETHFPRTVNGRGIHAACRFANPAARYNDRSVSLLIALKIVGDILELELDHDTVVTGAVDASGRIAPVDHLAEKIAVLQAHPTTQRLLYPAGGLPSTGSRLQLQPVGMFEDAALAYYGKPLRRKLRQIGRRQVLRSAAALATIPVGLLTFKNLFTNPVTEHDLRLFDTARNLYQQKSDYENALIILQSVLARFRKDSSSSGLRIKADIFAELGVIYLQQNHKSESTAALRQSIDCCKELRDNAYLADVLLRLGEVYRYTVAMDNQPQSGVIGVRCYEDANELLSPSMPLYKRLKGRYYSWVGHLYYWMEDYHLAERYSRKSLETFDEAEDNWSYQTARQHLGRVLIKVEKFTEAHDILQQTATSPVLQSPYYRARNAWNLSDLYFSLGREEQGMDYAASVHHLAQTFNLKGQKTLVVRLLNRHKKSLKMLPSTTERQSAA